MKRRRGRWAGRPRPSGQGAETPSGAGLPVGHLATDTARERVVLRRFAWQATPAGFAGIELLAIVAAFYWTRAIAVDLLAWLMRTLVGSGHRRHGVR
jgi:hypothetical protein